MALLLYAHRGVAQEPVPRDTQPVGFDTIRQRLGIDTLGRDSLRLDLSGVPLSKDSLEYPVEYSAADSMISDFTSKRIHLYGNAEVKYTTITLKASYIVLDYETSIVTAEGLPDSTGRLAGLPEFSDGQQTFNAGRMRYNFETRKGIVYDVSTKYNDITVRGTRTKFISGEEEPPASPEDTTRRSNDVLFSEDAIFTTCTADHPHFGIRSSKQKVVPDKLVVVGASNLEIMGVPTPLWLPFGFFPLSKGRRTGLIFPRDYEYSQQWGFGLRDIGWFFPLGEHINLTLTANVYLKGTYGFNAYSQYRKRYKYNGSLRLGFDSRRSEDNEGLVSRQNSFGISWSHNQDAAAHPTANFGGTINIQTNDFGQRVFNDANNVLTSQLNSNFRFEKRWPDKPYTFGASFNHSQNTQTGNVTINFPTVNFQTQALYPFKRKTGGGNRERWYESVVLRYRGEARNRFDATDTTLFNRKTLEDAQFGVQHEVNSGMSFKLFRYFSLNPGVRYEEVWYTKARDINFDPMPVVRIDTVFNADSSAFELVRDTIARGTLDTVDLYGFKSFREFSASIGLNTQIFGTLTFARGWLRGLRHVIKPTISLGYSPNYLNPGLGYFDFIPVSVNDPDNLRRYGIYDNGIFGGPPASGRQMALSYGITNIFEAKVFSRRDSTTKKIKLLDNLNINGSYNFAADSLRWSPVSMNGVARFFKGATTFQFNAVFDPYVKDASGRRIDRTFWRESGRLLRFEGAGASFNSRLTVGKLRAIFQGKEEEVVEDVRQPQQRRQPTLATAAEEDLLSLFENFSINHNIVFRWMPGDPRQKPFDITTNSINVQGSIRLTKYWNINLSSFGYDLVRKNFTYPFVGFSRDLHCWEMSMNWAPTRGTYSFSLRVKPGTLDFIKVPWEQNNADAIRAFQ